MMVSFIDTAEFSAHSATWLELLAAVAAKGVIVLLIALALNIAFRRASAAARHLVWSLALGSLLALPMLSFGLPSWSVPLLPDAFALAQPEAATNSPEPALLAPVTRQELETGTPSTSIKQQTRTGALSLPASPVPAPAIVKNSSSSLGWSSWALIIWMTGTFLFLARLLIGTVGVWWMTKRARKITSGEWARLAESLAPQLGLARPVMLLESSRITMPVTCGLVRPSVLLPADADDWSDERRRVVLLHELAHVKRRDCLTQVLAQVACALYWFNPLIWAAARQLRMERERACDDQVLYAGTKASDYADHLLDLARSFRSARCASVAAVAIARRSQLEGRLLAILDPNLSRRGLNRLASVAVGLVVAFIVLPLAAMRPSAQALAKASPRAEATRSITFDSTAQPAAPKAIAVAQMAPQSTGQTVQHQSEQAAAQALQAEMAQSAQSSQSAPSAQSAQSPEDGQDPQLAAQQPANPAQKDNSSTIEALTEALKDADAEVRQHALFALTQIGGPRATEALVAALKDADPEVREKAIWGLGISHGDGMVDTLIGALRDSHAGVRAKAAWSLGLKGDRRAVQPLISALKDENDEVRHMAAWALGLKGNGQAVEPLMDTLRDKDAEVRGMSAWALGLRGDKRAAKALQSALKDENAEVRKKAAWALGMLMIRNGEGVDGANDLDVDVDMDTDTDNKEGIARAKLKARIKQK